MSSSGRGSRLARDPAGRAGSFEEEARGMALIGREEEGLTSDAGDCMKVLFGIQSMVTAGGWTVFNARPLRTAFA